MMAMNGTPCGFNESVTQKQRPIPHMEHPVRLPRLNGTMNCIQVRSISETRGNTSCSEDSMTRTVPTRWQVDCPPEFRCSPCSHNFIPKQPSKTVSHQSLLHLFQESTSQQPSSIVNLSKKDSASDRTLAFYPNYPINQSPTNEPIHQPSVLRLRQP